MILIIKFLYLKKKKNFVIIVLNLKKNKKNNNDLKIKFENNKDTILNEIEKKIEKL
jgi:hypothetical protein